MTATGKKTLHIGVATLLVTLGVASAIFYASWQRFDPVISGRRLSAWLDQLVRSGANQAGPGDPAAHAEAEAAIRSLGTNAIAPLLAQLQATDSDLGWRMARMAESLFPPNGFGHKTGRERRTLAELGLIALGETKRLAIPKLSELLLNPDTTENAATVLIGIQPEGYALVLPALTNRNGRVRAQGACMAARAGSHAISVVPKLVAMLGDPEWIARLCAASSLGTLGLNADLVVPALVKSLPDESGLASSAKAMALEKFGSRLQPHLPLIRNLLNDGKLDSTSATILGRLVATNTPSM